jgi:hypothetical protein
MEAHLLVRYLIFMFAIPGGALIGFGSSPDYVAAGIFALTLGTICALTLQSKRFTEWLGKFF